jgi:hypothetical protein
MQRATRPCLAFAISFAFISANSNVLERRFDFANPDLFYIFDSRHFNAGSARAMDRAVPSPVDLDLDQLIFFLQLLGKIDAGDPLNLGEECSAIIDLFTCSFNPAAIARSRDPTEHSTNFLGFDGHWPDCPCVDSLTLAPGAREWLPDSA